MVRAPVLHCVQFSDGQERDKAAEAAYIEHELQVRGDGFWRPWHEVDDRKREHWERIATAVVRGINQNRIDERREERRTNEERKGSACAD